jgi:hypothetical protein
LSAGGRAAIKIDGSLKAFDRPSGTHKHEVRPGIANIGDKVMLCSDCERR